MQPKIYSLDQHKVPHEKIDRQAYYVIEKLRQEGFIAYLVGGSVRDLLLQIPPKDFDIATSAKPEEIRKLFRNCILIGRRFRLAHIRFGKKIIEVATFRSGDTETSSLITRDNLWGPPEEDVLRRDFTINGLFYNPETQTIIDYVEGFPDVEKKILRTIGKAEMRFQQDPVRMIRLLKFQARFNFSIEPATYEALALHKKEILKSSQARVLEELLRMLSLGHSKAFFSLLIQEGFFKLLFPHVHLDPALEQKIFELLEQGDLWIKKNPFQEIDRAVLLSSIFFPIFEKKLAILSEKKFLHFGIIAETTRNFLDQIFHPFFQVPRKMKISLFSIFLHQYRILPLEQTRKIPRIPQDPLFSLALQFFYLRSCVNADLSKIHASWEELLLKGKRKKTFSDT